MWKPRFASSALFVLSLCVLLLTPISHLYFLVVDLAALIGMLCGFCGVAASFLATPSHDGYFVPADNAVVRFMVKMELIDLSKDMGFCTYSFSVGILVLVPTLLSALLFFVIIFSQRWGVVEILTDISMIVAFCGCYLLGIYLFSRFVDKFPKMSIPIGIISLLFFGVMVVTTIMEATTTQILNMSSLGAAIIGGIALVFYLRHLLTKTRIYARICPQYTKTENANNA